MTETNKIGNIFNLISNIAASVAVGLLIYLLTVISQIKEDVAVLKNEIANLNELRGRVAKCEEKTYGLEGRLIKIETIHPEINKR